MQFLAEHDAQSVCEFVFIAGNFFSPPPRFPWLPLLSILMLSPFSTPSSPLQQHNSPLPPKFFSTWWPCLSMKIKSFQDGGRSTENQMQASASPGLMIGLPRTGRSWLPGSTCSFAAGNISLKLLGTGKHGRGLAGPLCSFLMMIRSPLSRNKTRGEPARSVSYHLSWLEALQWGHPALRCDRPDLKSHQIIQVLTFWSKEGLRHWKPSSSRSFFFFFQTTRVSYFRPIDPLAKKRFKRNTTQKKKKKK